MNIQILLTLVLILITAPLFAKDNFLVEKLTSKNATHADLAVLYQQIRGDIYFTNKEKSDLFVRFSKNDPDFIKYDKKKHEGFAYDSYVTATNKSNSRFKVKIGSLKTYDFHYDSSINNFVSQHNVELSNLWALVKILKVDKSLVEESCKKILSYGAAPVNPNAFDVNGALSRDELWEIKNKTIKRVTIEVNSRLSSDEKLYAICESESHPLNIKYQYSGEWKKLPSYVEKAKEK